jgi:hypothetical protein
MRSMNVKAAYRPELGERLGREEARDVRRLERRLESLRRHFGEELLQARDPGVGDHAFLLELRLGQIATGVLDDLAAGDLDLERALEAEDEVEKVDRLRA